LSIVLIKSILFNPFINLISCASFFVPGASDVTSKETINGPFSFMLIETFFVLSAVEGSFPGTYKY